MGDANGTAGAEGVGVEPAEDRWAELMDAREWWLRQDRQAARDEADRMGWTPSPADLLLSTEG